MPALGLFEMVIESRIPASSVFKSLTDLADQDIRNVAALASDLAEQAETVRRFSYVSVL